MTASAERLPTFEDELAGVEVLPGVNALSYLDHCRDRHPRLRERLNPRRVTAARTRAVYASIAELSTHFESKLENGRGDSYRKVQNTSFLTRSVGFLRIVDLALEEHASGRSRLVMLDALGGNGTLTRIVRASRPVEEVPFIVTSDVSGRMIESALAQGIPAIRQPVQDLLWFDDATFDAVIVAYGTHHIPVEQRLRAIGEARRVLKPGGRIVLQDFELGSPTTRFYDDVLDRYTVTGHRYDYFSKRDFERLLVENGFEEVSVFGSYDPFIHYAADGATAWGELLDYVHTLFALEKLPRGETERVVRETSTFDAAELPPDANGVAAPRVIEEDGRWRAEIPRVCLVGTGILR